MFLVLLLAAALFDAFTAPAAHAAMQLDRTRLVVTEADGSAIIQVQSKDPLPLLLQAWVDAGAEDVADESKNESEDESRDESEDEGKGEKARARLTPPDAPFITDPPVLYLNPGQRRALRVLSVDAPDTLPAERESLYWLNVLEVPALAPASAAPQTANHRLHMSVQSRLKLFYRPRALARYNGAAALPEADRLRFALTHDAAGQAWLTLDNPAPIHQSLATLALHLPQSHQPEATVIELDAPMLAPFARTRLALPAPIPPQTRVRVSFATLDDDGNLIQDQQTL